MEWYIRDTKLNYLVLFLRSREQKIQGRFTGNKEAAARRRFNANWVNVVTSMGHRKGQLYVGQGRTTLAGKTNCHGLSI